MRIEYTALGDSLTVGRGSGLFSSGFVQRFRHIMQADLEAEVSVSVFAKSGVKQKKSCTCCRCHMFKSGYKPLI